MRASAESGCVGAVVPGVWHSLRESANILLLVAVKNQKSLNHQQEEMRNMATKTATAPKVAPLSDRVVVKPLEETEQMRGGLYIPDTAKEKPQQGEVMAIGPGRTEDGKRVAMEVKVGDKVLYGKYSGTEVTIDNVQMLILRESDILAVVG